MITPRVGILSYKGFGLLHLTKFALNLSQAPISESRTIPSLPLGLQNPVWLIWDRWECTVSTLGVNWVLLITYGSSWKSSMELCYHASSYQRSWQPLWEQGTAFMGRLDHIGAECSWYFGGGPAVQLLSGEEGTADWVQFGHWCQYPFTVVLFHAPKPNIEVTVKTKTLSGELPKSTYM